MPSVIAENPKRYFDVKKGTKKVSPVVKLAEKPEARHWAMQMRSRADREATEARSDHDRSYWQTVRYMLDELLKEGRSVATWAASLALEKKHGSFKNSGFKAAVGDLFKIKG